MPPAPKPEQWVKSPAVMSPRISPDGLHTVYFNEENGEKFLNSFDIAAKKPGKINIGDANVQYVRWIDNNHVLVVSTVPARRVNAMIGGGSFLIAFVYDLSDGSLFRVFDNVPNFGGLVNGDLYPVVRNGKAQLIASATRSDLDGFAYLYAFDLDGKSFELIDRGPEDTEGWVVAGDGTLVGRSAYYDTAKREWVVEYHSGGSWHEIYRTTVVRRFPALLGLGRDGKTLLLSLPREDNSDIDDYVEIDSNGTLSQPLVDDPDLRSPEFDPRNYKLTGFTRFDGWYHYEYFDPAMQDLATKCQKAMEGYRMEIADYALDPKKVIVRSEGSDDAGTYYYIDFNTGLTMEVGEEYPDIPIEWVSDKQSFTYTAGDGTQIEAYLTLPPGKGAKNLPLVVLPHGGLASCSGLGTDYRVEMFATAGYAVLQPNYRGSSGYGQDFIAKGYGQWGKTRNTDVSDGVRALTAKGTIDPKRVCIVGEQLAGYMALAGVAMESGVYNCAVDITGLADVTAFMNRLASGENGVTSPGYIMYKHQFGDDFAAISPINHASTVSAPVLIIHSENDPTMLITQSTGMEGALKGAGKDVTLVKYEFLEQWSSHEDSRMQVWKTVLDFVSKHNPA